MQIVHRPTSALSSVSNWPDIPAVLQSIYQSRGIQDPQQLTGELKDLLPFNNLLGIDAAVAALIPVITEKKRLIVVGDFDVDGATSTAVVIRALKLMGAEHVDYLVPNRFDFGYGLTPPLVEVARQSQPDILLTVDNGIAAIDGVKAANDAGIQVVVTDHHLPGDALPDAVAIVNPNQPGCLFASKAACGCTVAFYVMLALRRALIDQGVLEAKAAPNMGQLLDLVALATVADVVPLDRNNRLLVAQGLKRLRAGHGQVGVRALLQVAKREAATIVGSDFGFAIGPRLNAAGRLDDMSIGIECLLTDNANIAIDYAQQLDQLNRSRRDIEQSMQQQAMTMLPDLTQVSTEQAQVVGVALLGEDWHPGVLGILASRIKEQLHRPVITCAIDSETEIKGSARSISGLHIRDALDLIDKRNPGVLIKFGGHAMAAGMTIAREHWHRFQSAFDQVCRELINDEDLQPRLLSDGQLNQQQLTLQLAEQIRYGGPWGQEFPEPLFDGKFEVRQHRVLADKHLKLTLKLPDSPLELDAIWFNADLEQWQGWQAVTASGLLMQVHCAYQLDVNYFRGRQSLQLMIRHLEIASESA